MPEEHIENVPPVESHETNVVNTDDVSPQHSIQTFSGLRNLMTRQSGFKIGCLNKH